MAAGSMCAASFYVPIRKVKSWSWESYWVVQGIVTWVLAPWIFAWFTIENMGGMMSAIPLYIKVTTVVFGVLYGVGGLTFGLTMRYLGIALGQSIALGLCAVFGTLIPPFFSGLGMFSTSSGILMLTGVSITIAGVVVVGYAGSLKSRDMSEKDKKAAVKEFALKKGILISILSGIMSACINFGLNGIPGMIDAGNVMQKLAAESGTREVFKTNLALFYVSLGCFFTNFVYCMYMNRKHRTFSDYYSVPFPVLLNNIVFSGLGGTLAFLQFFFFVMGQSFLPTEMFAFGWSILMALNIAFSNVWGIFLKEWKGAGNKTMVVLVTGIIILILSTFIVNL
ncbi:MAG: L-rhamnose/proton symporter RhaT [Victivallales bacterium]|nr:L-rhamnose/proton symporter RhaT [Victivallales bacterium]